MSELELSLKTSVIINDLKALQHACDEARIVMKQAAVEIQKLRQENDLLRARLRIVDLRAEKRADFDVSADSQPAFLRPQA